MDRMMKWVASLLVLLLSSVACDVGFGLPTPVPDTVELSVLISPPDKGYVEIDGAIITSGVAVPFPGGKLVNVVAKSNDAGWQFARRERDLAGVNASETLEMDTSKVVRAVFAPIGLSTPTPTSTPFPTATPLPVATPTPTQRGGTLRVGMIEDGLMFDPPLVTGRSDIAIVQHTYDTLVRRNPDLNLEPALAVEWSVNEDATEWAFNLRVDVKFSHGKAFTVDDVVFTFSRLFEVNSPLASVMARPSAIIAVDDRTVRFEFSEPNAVLLDSLAHYQASITPSDVDPGRFATETFGTGPFLWTSYAIGESAEFDKNGDYWWEGRPFADALSYVFFRSQAEMGAALKAGTIDVAYDLNFNSANTLKDDPGITVLARPTAGYMNLAMDTRVAPFNDERVRKAFQAATHRELINQSAQDGLAGC